MKSTKNALVSNNVNYPAIYNNMREAIKKCFEIDELTENANKAEAFSAYMKQAKDYETERMFKEIRFRAWRQIGVVLLDGLDIKQCTSWLQIAKLARKDTAHKSVAYLSDYEVRQAVMLAAVQEQKFENAVLLAEAKSIQAIIRTSDVSLERLTMGEEKFKKWVSEWAARRHDLTSKYAKIDEQRKKEEAIINEKIEKDRQERTELDRNYTLPEEIVIPAKVGLTLAPRFKRSFKKFEFLLNEPAFEQLRKSAFDNRTTMHEILREGLDMWFMSYGLKPLANGDESIECPSIYPWIDPNRPQRYGDFNDYRNCDDEPELPPGG